MAKKKTNREILGIAPAAGGVTKAVLLQREADLAKRIEKGEFKDELLAMARYYRNRFGWMARRMQKKSKASKSRRAS